MFIELLGTFFVLALFVDEIVEQLAYAGVLSASRGFFVKAARLDLHRARFFADCLNAQRTHQPQRRPLYKAAHILTANQRNVLAEFLAGEFNQPPPVPGLLLAHGLEHFGGGGIVLPQSLGEVGIHALVFFLQRNCKGEHFTFGEIVKLLHGALAYLPGRADDKPQARKGAKEPAEKSQGYPVMPGVLCG